MKTLMTTLVSLLLVAFAYGGELTTKNENLYTWFTGASIGYAQETTNLYTSVQLGVKAQDTHSVFLEVGAIETNQDLMAVPVMVNYQYDLDLASKWDWYLGAGAGMTYLESSKWVDSSWNPTFQAFTGLTYEFSESVDLYGGLKYTWVDHDFGADDEFIYEFGMRYTF